MSLLYSRKPHENLPKPAEQNPIDHLCSDKFYATKNRTYFEVLAGIEVCVTVQTVNVDDKMKFPYQNN
jgi:hypothetical protein